jgi:hypothetical protein
VQHFFFFQNHETIKPIKVESKNSRKANKIQSAIDLSAKARDHNGQGTTSPKTNHQANHPTKFSVMQMLHQNLLKPPLPNPINI